MLRELLPVLIAGLVPFVVLTLIVIGTAFSFVAWQPPITQTILLGTPNSANGMTAISSDATGVYAGGFVGVPSATPTYMFVNRYDLNGQQVWSRHVGNPHGSGINGIAVGADGVYVAGNANTSSFVTGYDFNGNQIWNSQFGNISAAATGISAGPVGVYVVGYDTGSYFVKDYSFNGSLVWTRLFGTSPGDVSVFSDLSEVYVMSSGTAPSLVQTGSSLVQKYDLNGTLDWTRTCHCDSAGSNGIAEDSTGLYLVGTVQTADGISDGFLAKYDSGGNQDWTTSFSAPGYNGFRGASVSADASGVYLATTTSDSRSLVMKYDANGNRLWSFRMSLSWASEPPTGLNALAVAKDGVYLGGDSVSEDRDTVAFLALVMRSSSLVFFGVNPPFSFILVALLAVLSVICIRWFRARWRNRLLTHATLGSHRREGIPSDTNRRV